MCCVLWVVCAVCCVGVGCSVFGSLCVVCVCLFGEQIYSCYLLTYLITYSMVQSP